jgi:hypothetical protein
VGLKGKTNKWIRNSLNFIELPLVPSLDLLTFSLVDHDSIPKTLPKPPVLAVLCLELTQLVGMLAQFVLSGVGGVDEAFAAPLAFVDLLACMSTGDVVQQILLPLVLA